MTRLVQIAITISIFFIFLGAWKLYVEVTGISPFLLPPPETVFLEIVAFASDTSVWGHLRVTLTETLLGFAIATIVGVSVGALLGKVAVLERILRPYIVATQVIPKVALAPLFVLWFGFGIQSKVFLAALLAFFPIVTNTILGVKSVTEGHSDVMKSLNASKWQTFTKLELRNAFPYIIAGMEVGIVLAQIGAIVGEYLGGSSGLGYLAVATLNALQVGRLFGVIFVLTLMGFLLFSSIGMLRRFLIPWHESVYVRESTGRASLA